MHFRSSRRFGAAALLVSRPSALVDRDEEATAPLRRRSRHINSLEIEQ
jgi:hypothetical protein